MSTARLSRLALVAGLVAESIATCAPTARAQAVDGPVASTLLRLFTDSGRISVRSTVEDWTVPLGTNTSLQVHWNNEHVTIPGISAPPGSKEAVDAITTASRPIAGDPYRDFEKTRNEVQGDVTRGAASANYYISKESDYLAQQVGGAWARDFRDQTLNLSLGSSWAWDDIEPLANGTVQAAANTKRTLHWNAVATEVLSPTTLLRFGLEYNLVHGLQHNPYRNVFAGGSHVPERHPDKRERRDTFLRLHQYFGDRSSAKLSYRLYGDDWGITSHEVGGTLSQYVTHGVAASWDYRWYTQTHARFWRDTYASTDGVDGYLSGDYRMNDLASHLFGLSLRADLADLAPERRWLGRSALWLNVERYFNSNNYSADILEAGLDFRFR